MKQVLCLLAILALLLTCSLIAQRSISQVPDGIWTEGQNPPTDVFWKNRAYVLISVADFPVADRTSGELVAKSIIPYVAAAAKKCSPEKIIQNGYRIFPSGEDFNLRIALYREE